MKQHSPAEHSSLCPICRSPVDAETLAITYSCVELWLKTKPRCLHTDTVVLPEIYRTYVGWCKRRSITPRTRLGFAKLFADAFPESLSRQVRPAHGKTKKRVRVRYLLTGHFITRDDPDDWDFL